MLERYFVKPVTVDRIRASWIGGPIEGYVGWLSEQGYASRNVFRRVPILVQFGAFAAASGLDGSTSCLDTLMRSLPSGFRRMAAGRVRRLVGRSPLMPAARSSRCCGLPFLICLLPIIAHI
jgi:integrase/recombinase XerD